MLRNTGALRGIAIGGLTAFVLILLAAAAPAEDGWRADNQTDFTVNVYWAAIGCTGAADRCVRSDGNIRNVCRHQELAPGKSAGYTFAAEATERSKLVCAVNQGSLSAITRATADRAKTGIRHNEVDGAPEWYRD